MYLTDREEGGAYLEASRHVQISGDSRVSPEADVVGGKNNRPSVTVMQNDLISLNCTHAFDCCSSSGSTEERHGDDG